MIYNPREDSYFLVEILENLNLNLKDKEILDMGTGSGIISEFLIKKTEKKNITASDINGEALEKARELGVKIIKSDLFENIDRKFDIIIFNPPYLPEHEYDRKKDVTGGERGDETILKFLEQSKNYLKEEGKIILLISSLTPRYKINKILKKFNKKKLGEKLLFFEKLEVWLISV